jgi:hypothetical protein
MITGNMSGSSTTVASKNQAGENETFKRNGFLAGAGIIVRS